MVSCPGNIVPELACAPFAGPELQLGHFVRLKTQMTHGGSDPLPNWPIWNVIQSDPCDPLEILMFFTSNNLMSIILVLNFNFQVTFIIPKFIAIASTSGAMRLRIGVMIWRADTLAFLFEQFYQFHSDPFWPWTFFNIDPSWWSSWRSQNSDRNDPLTQWPKTHLQLCTER